MKLIFTTLILLKSMSAVACYCGLLQPYKNKEDLKTYDFIALAEIKDLKPLNPAVGSQSVEAGIIIKELFKGNPVTAVYDDAYRSSCDMGLRRGEQWLLFGTVYKGRMLVGSCTYSQPYRDSTGTRDWNYQGAIERLNALKLIFDHRFATVPKERIFYPDGKLEIVQSVRNKKLDGVRKIYYPSGRLYVIERFKRGERIDYRNVYSVSGQLLFHEEYEGGLVTKKIAYEDSTFTAKMLSTTAEIGDIRFAGIKRDRVTIARAIDSLRATIAWGHYQSLTQLNSNGKSYTNQFYYNTGQLRSKGFFDIENQKSEFYHYLENGRLQFYEKKDFKKDEDLEYDYKPDGTKKEFVKKCLYCDVYFKEIAEAVKPEKIFIE